MQRFVDLVTPDRLTPVRWHLWLNTAGWFAQCLSRFTLKLSVEVALTTFSGNEFHIHCRGSTLTEVVLSEFFCTSGLE